MFQWIKGLIVPVLAILAVVTLFGLSMVDNYATSKPVYATESFTLQLPAQDAKCPYKPVDALKNWQEDPKAIGFQYLLVSEPTQVKQFVDKWNEDSPQKLEYSDAVKLQIFALPDLSPRALIVTYNADDCAVWEMGWNVVEVQIVLDKLGLKLAPGETRSWTSGDVVAKLDSVGRQRGDRPLDPPQPAHPSWVR